MLLFTRTTETNDLIYVIYIRIANIIIMRRRHLGLEGIGIS